ncbi:ABC transporter substrate-binding protein [Roseococcus sp. YIM B11640]|uniref:ABC transporter substrate-binding protein n=1 Tax=Roseococcus sp. YIM B11640 TaxID=3133973 RepID=UPI003C7A3D8B
MSQFRLHGRRALLAGAAGLAATPALAQHHHHGAATPAAATPAVAPLPERVKLKLTWNATALCTSPIAVADREGIFARYNLDVELINFGASTEALLEAIATGHADAGVGMALRWLKPLEQGFDVKITAGTHGGCMRLLGGRGTGITEDIASLRGKTIAVTDMAAPDKNFFSILFARHGINPDRDVTWKVFPANVFELALSRGEVQAVALGDPLAYQYRKRLNLIEVSTNLSEDYADRACCVLGVRGSLIRSNRPVAAALSQALVDAQTLVSRDHDIAARTFAAYAPGGVSVTEMREILESHTHGHSPVGTQLRDELQAYITDLKRINVIRANTDPARMAERITANVFA